MIETATLNDTEIIQHPNGWRCHVDAQSPWHIWPVADLRPHIVDAECWCGATEDDGIVVHRSLDRREEYEAGRKAS